MYLVFGYFFEVLVSVGDGIVGVDVSYEMGDFVFGIGLDFWVGGYIMVCWFFWVGVLVGFLGIVDIMD